MPGNSPYIGESAFSVSRPFRNIRDICNIHGIHGIHGIRHRANIRPFAPDGTGCIANKPFSRVKLPVDKITIRTGELAWARRILILGPGRVFWAHS